MQTIEQNLSSFIKRGVIKMCTWHVHFFYLGPTLSFKTFKRSSSMTALQYLQPLLVTMNSKQLPVLNRKIYLLTNFQYTTS